MEKQEKQQKQQALPEEAEKQEVCPLKDSEVEAAAGGKNFYPRRLIQSHFKEMY